MLELRCVTSAKSTKQQTLSFTCCFFFFCGIATQQVCVQFFNGQIHWKLVTSYLVRISVEPKTYVETALLWKERH